MASYFPLVNGVFIPFLTFSYTNYEYYFLFFIFYRYAGGLNLNGKYTLPYFIYLNNGIVFNIIMLV